MTLSALINRLLTIEKQQGGMYGGSEVRIASGSVSHPIMDVETDFPSAVFIII